MIKKVVLWFAWRFQYLTPCRGCDKLTAIEVIAYREGFCEECWFTLEQIRADIVASYIWRMFANRDNN